MAGAHNLQLSCQKLPQLEGLDINCVCRLQVPDVTP